MLGDKGLIRTHEYNTTLPCFDHHRDDFLHRDDHMHDIELPEMVPLIHSRGKQIARDIGPRTAKQMRNTSKILSDTVDSLFELIEIGDIAGVVANFTFCLSPLGKRG